MKRAAEVIISHNQDILDVWERVVKKEIKASQDTESIILRNLIPSLLENIAKLIDSLEEQNETPDKEKCKEIVQQSLDHGRHRAISKNYTARQIIEEFMLLNRVLTDLLIRENAYSTNTGIILTYSLETAMAYSIESFDKSIQIMRKKLVRTLTHDIRNPVSAAYLAVSMLDYEEGETQLVKLKDIARRSLRRSLDLMEGLLDAISIKAGEGAILQFGKGDLLKDLKGEYVEAREVFSHELIFKCDEEKIEGVYDGTAVRRILENLLSNAAKYGVEDKPITISVEDQEEEVCISVHNYGNSVSEEDQEEIFKFMSRASGNETDLKSWGIGLSFVKMAAEAHKGYVKIKSTPETGTTFTVILNKFANQPGKVRTRLNYKL